MKQSTKAKAKKITPARLSEEEKKKVEEVALRVYNLLQMKGFSRSEYILVGGGTSPIGDEHHPWTNQE